MEGEQTTTVIKSCARGSRHYCKLSDVKPDVAFDWTDAAQSKQVEVWCCWMSSAAVGTLVCTFTLLEDHNIQAKLNK